MQAYSGDREQREMKTEELEELIIRSRRGDQEAQEELIRAAQERVYYHCKKIIKNEEDVQDAVQDVLFSMFRNLDSLREPAAFWGWLNQMTVHICLKRVSKKQREGRYQDLAAGTALESMENLDDQEIPDKALDNEETRRMVRELVDALPEAQKLCVLMYYYDSMSVGEIARIMETSEGTVKSRLHYARKSIREGVERYAAQGLKLYGMPVVPFLSYFLEKEAETLAAAGGSAAVIAMSGTGVTIAAGTAGVLAHKGAAAVAVLVLAGAVTGGALLLRPHRPPVPEPPPPAIEAPTERKAPAEERTQSHTAEEPVQEVREVPPDTEPAAPLSPVPAVLLTPEPKNTEQAEPVPVLPALSPTEGAVPLLTVLTPWVPEERPTPEEEPPEEEIRPARPDDRDSDQDSGEDDTSNSPAPPEPEEVLYYPNPDFGTFLGIRDGVYEFAIEIESDQRRQPFPFVDASGEMPYYDFRAESSDDGVVQFEGPNILGWNTGTAEVRYYIRLDRDSTEEIEALVHVTVVSRKPADPEPVIMVNPVCGKYEGQKNKVHIFRLELTQGEKGPPPLLIPERYYIHRESGNEGVAVWEEDGGFRAAGEGSTDLRLYISETEGGPYDLKAIVYVTVLGRKPAEPSEPLEVIEGTLTEGYGYSSMFQRVWPEQAVGRYTYASTNPAAVSVREYGGFSLLSPGNAVLTATDEAAGKQYRLTVEVEDRYFQEMKLKDLTVQEGETVFHGIDGYMSGTYDDFVQAEWTSSDPSVFTVENFASEEYYMTPNSRVTGVSAGTAELSVVLYLRVDTCLGPQEMTAKSSCQVTVEPLPEERKQITAKRGYSSSFPKEWSGVPADLRYTSSAPETVQVTDTGFFCVLKAGEAVLTGEGSKGRWILEVKAEPGFNWEYSISPAEKELWEGKSQYMYLVSTLPGGITKEGGEWESANPEIASVESSSAEGCLITGVSPGETVITGTIRFTVDVAAGVWTMEDEVVIPVTVKSSGASEEGRQKTLAGFGYRSGGGFLSSFQDEWGDALPENLTFESSSPEIVYIGANGAFVTRGAGTATLTAADPQEPDAPYRLTVTVEEGADWSRKITPEELSIAKGEWYKGLDDLSYEFPLSVTSSHWYSSAPEVVEVTDLRESLHCLKPLTPGTAEITGELEFTDELLGDVYQETVTYTVTVTE